MSEFSTYKWSCLAIGHSDGRISTPFTFIYSNLELEFLFIRIIIHILLTILDY
jgi:hypothetical protein